jgi:hypothetical protein
MTTFIDFVPNPNGAVTFLVTLDGTEYRAQVMWNLFGQRYYLNVYTLNGGLVFSVPLIGSLNGFNIESINWYSGRATVKLLNIPNWAFGVTGNLTISGCTPDVYNGTVKGLTLAHDSRSFSYPLAVDPGLPSVVGVVYANINLAAGYVETSTLVYRPANRQFEVTP